MFDGHPGGSIALKTHNAGGGPPQAGPGVQGQYVYWICMPFPRPETVEATDVPTPADLDRNSFWELVTEGHTTCGVELVETAFVRMGSRLPYAPTAAPEPPRLFLSLRCSSAKPSESTSESVTGASLSSPASASVQSGLGCEGERDLVLDLFESIERSRDLSRTSSRE